MKGKHQDLRDALTAARKVLDRAKPEGEGDGLEARSGLEKPNDNKLDLTPQLISGPVQYKVCSVRVLFSSSTVFASTKPPV